MSTKKQRWFWQLRVFLIERHSWTWEQVKELSFAEVSYVYEKPVLDACHIVHKDFR